MAKTLSPAKAVNMLALKYPKVLSEGWSVQLVNEAIEWVWKRYPWRGSLVELAPFHPVREEPDYGSPLVVVPTDFLGLHKVWLRETQQGIGVRPLTVKDNAEISISPGIPDVITYVSEKNAFRLHPRPNIGGCYWWVEGTYKKVPTRITAETLNSSVLPWDDIYFNVFKKALEAKIKEDLIGSQDAGNAIMYADHLIDQMAIAENLVSGVTIVAPAENLELGGY